MNIQTHIAELARQLLPVYENIITATDNSWWIITTITGLSKTELILKKNILLTSEQENKLALWIEKLLHEHMPLQYLIGTVPFLDLELQITPPILIPRPETEAWVADLIKQLKKSPPHNIIDLCTGSGCIGLALAHAFPHSSVYAGDINSDALKLAKENAQANNIKNINFVQSNLFENIPQQPFDLIVSNPPYLSEQEWHELAPNVQAWEDPRALIAADEGYALIEKIIAQAPPFLAKNGMLCIEIGHTQGTRVAQLFTQHSFEQVQIIKDLHHKDRMVQGIWKAQ